MKEWLGIVQSCVVITAALFTISGVLFWKKQVMGKRKIEIAEKILMLFYDARDAVVFSRLKCEYAGEDSLIKNKYGKTVETNVNFIKSMIPYERLQLARDTFGEIQSMYYSYAVVLGGSYETFHKLLAIMSKITSASFRVGKIWDERDKVQGQDIDPDKEKLLKECEEAIWSSDVHDQLNESLNEVVSEVEKVCGKYISINNKTMPGNLDFALDRLRAKLLGH